MLRPFLRPSIPRLASSEEVKAAILLFYGSLDEQQRRLFAGLESIRLGHGGGTLLGMLGGTVGAGFSAPVN